MQIGRICASCPSRVTRRAGRQAAFGGRMAPGGGAWWWCMGVHGGPLFPAVVIFLLAAHFALNFKERAEQAPMDLVLRLPPCAPKGGRENREEKNISPRKKDTLCPTAFDSDIPPLPPTFAAHARGACQSSCSKPALPPDLALQQATLSGNLIGQSVSWMTRTGRCTMPTASQA